MATHGYTWLHQLRIPAEDALRHGDARRQMEAAHGSSGTFAEAASISCQKSAGEEPPRDACDAGVNGADVAGLEGGSAACGDGQEAGGRLHI